MFLPKRVPTCSTLHLCALCYTPAESPWSFQRAGYEEVRPWGSQQNLSEEQIRQDVLGGPVKCVGVEQRGRTQRVGTLSSADVMPAPGLQAKGKVGIRLSSEHTSLGPMQPEWGFYGKRRDQTTPFGACLNPGEGLKFGANLGGRQCKGCLLYTSDAADDYLEV